MKIKIFLSALGIWCVLTVMAVLNGVFRIAVLEPLLGIFPGAHIASTLLLLAIILLISFFYIRNSTHEWGKNELFIIGLLWLVLTVGFEFLFGHYVAGVSWKALCVDYNVMKGRIWILVPIAVFSAPLLWGMHAGRQNAALLRRPVKFFALLGILLIVISLAFYRNAVSYKARPPFYKEIKKIIAPLQYSGIYDLARPEVMINLDFKKHNWQLANIHRFDDKGKLLLAQGRFGLCGELAAAVYEKIKGLFDDSYLIDYARAAESGYFLYPQSTHIVLRVTRPSFMSQTIYILDPSFQRYGELNEFDDYLFFESMPNIPFVEKKETDESFAVGTATPVFIKSGFLIMLSVEKQNGFFDKDNFSLSLTASRRFKYSGRYLLALRKNNGKDEILENQSLVENILSLDEYEVLRKRMLQWFVKLSQGEDTLKVQKKLH
jgi:hypothetical protein